VILTGESGRFGFAFAKVYPPVVSAGREPVEGWYSIDAINDMSRNKHKFKKHRANKQANEETHKATLMNSEEATAKGHTETNANAGKETAANEEPSWWRRSKQWMQKDKTFTDWCVAAFTFILAAAAIHQFVIMGGQLDTMRKDQRPWIDLTFTSNSNALQVGYPITAAAHVVNEGKTPARAVTSDIVIEMVKNGDEPRLDYPLPHSRFTTGAVFPNRPMDSPVFNRVRTAADGVSVETDPVTQAEFDDFNQGNSFIVVYGTVSYKDFFGTSHWTRMCGFFAKPGGTKGFSAKQCTDYADIDGN
jgi:hypothetical protein